MQINMQGHLLVGSILQQGQIGDLYSSYTQHLDHFQPGNLKQKFKFQPRFQTNRAPRAPKSLHLVLEVPCIHSLFQGDLQQTSYIAQISGYF